MVQIENLSYMTKLLRHVISAEDFPSNLTLVLGLLTAEWQGQSFTAAEFSCLKVLFTTYTLLSFPLQALAHRMSWLTHSLDRKLILSSLPHAEKCTFCNQWAEPTHPSRKLHKDRWCRGRGGKKTGQHVKVISWKENVPW